MAKRTTEQGPEQSGPDELADAWGVWLELRWDFNLPNWDASVMALPSGVGALKTAARHRAGLLRALEVRDDDAIADKLELMMRTTAMAHGKAMALSGQKLSTGGRKGGEASRDSRRGEGSKRAAILAAAAEYTGSEEVMVAVIARKTGATDTYVRRVMKNPNL